MKINQVLEGKTTKVTPPKPRNFVAKNAVQSGAGAHKDKKKAAKQGDTKHKKKEMELAESSETPSTIQQIASKVGDTLANALPQEYRPFDNQTAANNNAKYKQTQTKEEYDGEYDDETGMAENQLQTIQRCAREMEENLIDGENLPEWIQSKITIAKENLVTAFDYILSQHQNGEVEEGHYRRPGSPTAYDRDYASSVSGMGKRDSYAYQMDGGANDEGWDEEPRGKYQAPEDKPVLQGYFFYNVPAGMEQEAAIYGVKPTKSGKWAKAKYTTSGRSFDMQKDGADKAFGPGRWWAPK